MVVPLGNLIPFFLRQLMPLTPHGSLQGSCYWATNLKNCSKMKKIHPFHSWMKKRVQEKVRTLHLLAAKGDSNHALAFSFESIVREKIFQALIIV